ncbi:3-hydroxyacyl-CoA dehydratase PASTICCINO 2 [Termitomyces sp. T112]|nr:3-hydroxyacyl-CoA dehydratase PASTICCINO 2 [Termitomyces sp. T112]
MARPLVRYYLVLFNLVSFLGWSYLLVLTLAHLFNIDGSSPSTVPPQTASAALSRFLSSLPLFNAWTSPSFEARLHPALRPVYLRATTAYTRVGTPTAAVQSLAAMEVLHVLLGWVRAPLPTTAAQVSSRLFLVWGIVEQFTDVRTNPLYTSMILSWSITEVIRYAFYALTLMGSEPRLLLWLRYTTFYILYLTGASSEALLIYATLPSSSPIPGWRSWIHGMWTPTDYARAVLFTIWWPGLYVLYTYMIGQRKRVLGKDRGRRLGSKGDKAL